MTMSNLETTRLAKDDTLLRRRLWMIAESILPRVMERHCPSLLHPWLKAMIDENAGHPAMPGLLEEIISMTRARFTSIEGCAMAGVIVRLAEGHPDLQEVARKTAMEIMRPYLHYPQRSPGFSMAIASRGVRSTSSAMEHYLELAHELATLESTYGINAVVLAQVYHGTSPASPATKQEAHELVWGAYPEIPLMSLREFRHKLWSMPAARTQEVGAPALA